MSLGFNALSTMSATNLAMYFRDVLSACNGRFSLLESRPPHTFPTFVDNNTNIRFRYVPAGEFTFGHSENEIAAARQISSQLPYDPSDLFEPQCKTVNHILVTEFPVSCVDYERATGNVVPYFYSQHEAAGLTFTEVTTFADKFKLRLPTEVEWEWFVRCGNQTLFPFGNELPSDEELEGWMQTDFASPQCKHNQFGLSGIFMGEWCCDRYDPALPSGQENQVIRGGAAGFWPWQSTNEWIWCMCAMRMSSKGLIDGTAAWRMVFVLD